jgi:hypothetical protein
MNPRRCCRRTPCAGGDLYRKDSWISHVRKSAALILPGAFLAFLPKCPMCFAAYVALGTGFSLSFGSAQILMRALTLLCISTLAFCVVRRMVKYVHQKSSFSLPSNSTPQ